MAREPVVPRCQMFGPQTRTPQDHRTRLPTAQFLQHRHGVDCCSPITQRCASARETAAVPSQLAWLLSKGFGSLRGNATRHHLGMDAV